MMIQTILFTSAEFSGILGIFFLESAYGCVDDASQNCLAYAGCEALVNTPEVYLNKNNNYDKSSNTKNVAVTEEEEESNVDAFITSLEAACSSESLKTLEGIQQCHNKCQTHLCCFTKDATLTGEDCSTTHVEACNAYKPCERLVTSSGGQNPSISSSSPDLFEVNKAVRDACTLPQNPSMITEDWVVRCHNVCAPRLCCLVDYKLGSNCRDIVGEEECNNYDICNVLINNSGGEISDVHQIENKLGSVESVCNSKVSENPLQFEACEVRCDGRSCCFEEMPTYSCYEMVSNYFIFILEPSSFYFCCKSHLA